MTCFWKTTVTRLALSSVLLITILVQPGRAADGAELSPPEIPVGLDAYRQWDKWPYQRIGARAYMRSTYDRAGGNESADASHYLYQLRDDFNVSLDVEGRGYLYFARYNHWHGSPWHYEVDGRDHLVKETTTADPTRKLEHAVFLPEKPFPSPLTFTYETTKGADLMWVPIGFEDRFRMAYSRTFYGTGYYIYHLYAPGANLSHPIKSWDGESAPDEDVLELLRRAGTDVAPKRETEEGKSVYLQRQFKTFSLLPGETKTLAELEGSWMVRALKISIPEKHAVDFGRARLRITWDGREDASVDAPIALFFGAGTLHNRENKEYLVKALPVNVRFKDKRVDLACYFPMPFFESAKVELIAPDDKPIENAQFWIRYQEYVEPPEHVGYFHATYHDHVDARLGHDLVFLDTDKVEGGGPWSGNFVGTSFIFSDRGVLRTLEADPRFFFDDSQTPQAYGTGTEEWGGGGDYWGGLTMTLPLAGHPVGVRRPEHAKVKEDLIESAYRFLLADLMPFGKRALIRLEHGGHNDSTEHYQSVTYWYGAPQATLVMTDSIDIGDSTSEADHNYLSPEASEPYTFSSRYEWGPDHRKIDGKRVETYPEQTATGRKTTTGSEFMVNLRKDNWGVLLRRTLDYQYPNQRAKVFVADAGESEPAWRQAGVWYLAGSNTCYYSYPGSSGKVKYRDRARGELAKTEPKVQTSNRRLRDDEFLVSHELTRGREAIRVRIEFTPVDIPLLPDMEVAEQAWSEIAYQAYCYVLPRHGEEGNGSEKKE